jgi:ipoprotein LpqH
VKRGLTAAVTGAAVLAVALSGCSSNKARSGGGGTSGSSTTGPSSAATGGTAGTKVIIDGKDQNVSDGAVVCTKIGTEVSITIGGAGSGINARVTDANPPEVKSVGLGSVNGVALAYMAGTGQGNATATKNGNGYKITGNATGVDVANPTTPVKKPFEINVTCP